MSRDDRELLCRYLDSEAADLRAPAAADAAGPLGGGGPQVPTEIREFLKADPSFELLGNAVANPLALTPASADDDDDIVGTTRLKRSYRAAMLLSSDARRAAEIRRRGAEVDDAHEAGALTMGQERAGLLAKRLFDAYGKGGDAAAHVPHVNHLLRALLEGYPNAVVSAACAGGAASHLGRMLESPCASLSSSSSPLPVLTALVSTGCTGRVTPEGGEKPQPPQDPMAALGLTPAGAMPRDVRPVVTKGHRRKFVRSLGEWGLLDRMVDEMTRPEGGGAAGGDGAAAASASSSAAAASSSRADHAEAVCDALLSVVDSVGYPPPPPPGADPSDLEADESVGGEEILLSPFLRAEDGGGGASEGGGAVQKLASAAADGDPAAARALLGVFDMATGRSKLRSAPPAVDASDDGDVAAKSPDKGGGSGGGPKPPGAAAEDSTQEDDPRRNNRLRRMGLTDAMHAGLVSCLDLVVRGMDLGGCFPPGPAAADADDSNGEGVPVHHPGHCVVERPFTTRRLNLITLLADVVSYEEGASSVDNGGKRESATEAGGKKKKGGKGSGRGTKGKGTEDTQDAKGDAATASTVEAKYAAASRAMDKLAELPLPPPPPPANKPSAAKSSADAGDSSSGNSVVHNPWPALVDLLFAYPENNLYQVQFYRLFLSPVLAHHEPTLRAAVQRSKFVGRAVTVCRTGRSGAAPSHRGVLMRCLNAMRLRAESLPPRAWLRHYLDSHDGWKAFLGDLARMTAEQQRPGGGIPPPPRGLLLPGGPAAVAGPPAMRMAALGRGAPPEEAEEEASSSSSPSPPLPPAEADIGLGSAYASDLGFDASIVPYRPEDRSPSAANVGGAGGSEGGAAAAGGDALVGGGGGTKKKKNKGKKKKKKKKKKKSEEADAGTSAEEREGADDESDGEDNDK